MYMNQTVPYLPQQLNKITHEVISYIPATISVDNIRIAKDIFHILNYISKSQAGLNALAEYNFAILNRVVGRVMLQCMSIVENKREEVNVSEIVNDSLELLTSVYISCGNDIADIKQVESQAFSREKLRSSISLFASSRMLLLKFCFS